MANRRDSVRDSLAKRVSNSQASKTPLRHRALESKSSLDKDLLKIERLEEATRAVFGGRIGLVIALAFLVVAGLLAGSQVDAGQNALLMVVAAVIGGYMALTIGANDVANNVGPAVGARALTMTGALALAAVFECAGGLLAGGGVVETISQDLIDPALVPNTDVFIWVMMSALLASALWVHLATFLGAPISTTHAIVGGVLGAGLAGVGPSAIDWLLVAQIFVSWMTTPIVGGLVAASLLAFCPSRMAQMMSPMRSAHSPPFSTVPYQGSSFAKWGCRSGSRWSAPWGSALACFSLARGSCALSVNRSQG